MRFIRFVRSLVLTVLLTATLVIGTTAPALAVSLVPEQAPFFNGSVHAIVHRGSTIYVGGSFTRMTRGGRAWPRNRLAAFSPAGTLTAWSPQASGVIGVRARTADPARHTLSAGGDFTRVASRTHKRYALFG